MNFLEKELEDWFFEHPEAFVCEVEWTHRQLKLPSGIADVVGVDTESNIHLVELKAVSLSSKDICQVIRYRADIKLACRNSAVSAYLVGPGHIPGPLQYEADAAGVKLISVAPSFQLDGPWGFTNESKIKRAEELGSNEHLQELRDAREEYRNKLIDKWECEQAQDTQDFYSEIVESWEASNARN